MCSFERSKIGSIVLLALCPSEADGTLVPQYLAGQWIESVTDWAIRITDWGLFTDWVSSHARLADPIRPMPNKGKAGHSGLPIALISRLPDWVVHSVLPIAIHRLLHRLYPLASCGEQCYAPSSSDFLFIRGDDYKTMTVSLITSGRCCKARKS